ncbi:MAG: thiol:disulfide interchange protein DsbA/DsbL [Cytophagia bacterium]|nr:thiol:disulfide interchange protein DsbA/DsbL [Cytophagia bacterium]
MKKVFLALGLLTVVACSSSAQSQFVEGQHYEVVADKKSDEPVVTEFFSLFCPHCFSFDPFIDSLRSSLPKGVDFERSHVDYIPRDNKAVSFGIVKAYNVMIDLGKEEELRQAFFAAIHIKQETIETEEKIKQLFVDQGVSASKFDELYNSPSVINRSKAMSKLWMERKIDNVPTVVVNQKYKINMGILKGMDEFRELTAFLLKQK